MQHNPQHKHWNSVALCEVDSMVYRIASIPFLLEVRSGSALFSFVLPFV